MFAVSKGAVLN